MKIKISNRKELQLSVVVEGNTQSKNLVFIIHGLTGSKDQPHMIGMRSAFIESDFTVVSFDTAFSFGESEGDSINATATSYIEDLEDVIQWASGQSWYKESFFLGGHSIGGLSSIVYTTQHPDKIKALFPISSVVSNQFTSLSNDPTFMNTWKKKGYFEKVSKSLPGKKGRVGWNLKEDLDKYNALEIAPKIFCPVLLMVGSSDDSTPTYSQEKLLEALGSNKKQLHVIPGIVQNPTTPQEIEAMKNIIKCWVSGV